MILPKVGTRVRTNSKCGPTSIGMGLMGKIVRVYFDENTFRLDLQWDDGSQVSTTGWSEPLWDMLDFLDECSPTLRSAELPSLECPCKIFRGDCDYHRETK